jgi:D-hexose-6-phosphate mutarotase
LTDVQDDDWMRKVCVETCNVQPSAVELQPAARHAMKLTVAVSSIQPI